MTKNQCLSRSLCQTASLAIRPSSSPSSCVIYTLDSCKAFATTSIAATGSSGCAISVICSPTWMSPSLPSSKQAFKCVANSSMQRKAGRSKKGLYVPVNPMFHLYQILRHEFWFVRNTKFHNAFLLTGYDAGVAPRPVRCSTRSQYPLSSNK